MFSAQLTTLWYRSVDSQAGLDLNIPANTRECLTLIDFLASLYFVSYAYLQEIHNQLTNFE
jgi:hypothetical protein